MNRIIEALSEQFGPTTLGNLKKINLKTYGDSERHLGDVIGEIIFNALEAWVRNPANRVKLSEIKKDRAFKRFSKDWYDEKPPMGYIFDQIKKQLLQ